LVWHPFLNMHQTKLKLIWSILKPIQNIFKLVKTCYK
jgi:hypothetical protein